MHLEVEIGALNETAGDVRRCLAVARDFADHRDHLTAMVEDCGSNNLRDRAEHFIGRWRYGMGLIVSDAERLAAELDHAAEEYRRLEAELIAPPPE